MEEQRIHEVFKLSVIGKAAFALSECINGVLLWMIGSDTIVNLAKSLTRQELIEDPRDFIATHLLTWAETFSVETRHFYAFYLFSHGIVKLVLMIQLLRNRFWAYPASLVVMGLFIVYQLYRFSYTHSLGLIALTVFDLIVMWLVWHEYRVVRQKRMVAR